MLTSQVTWHTAKKSTTNKLHTSRINLSLQYTRGPVISTACIQQQLHSLFPLENKQTGIHSRAMNNRTSKWSSCQRTWTASAAMPNERRDAQAGSFRKLCLTPNRTSKVTPFSQLILLLLPSSWSLWRKKEMRLSQSYQQLLVSSFSPPGSSQGRKTQPCKTCFFSKFQSIILSIICTSTSSGERKHSTNLSKHLAGALGLTCPAGLLVGCKIPLTSCTCGALADL